MPHQMVACAKFGYSKESIVAIPSEHLKEFGHHTPEASVIFKHNVHVMFKEV